MIDLLLKLGGLQALIIAVFLFRKKANNDNSNVILAFLLFSLAFSCLFYSFNNLEFYLKFPHLIRVDWGIPLLFGPLVYLYTLELLNDGKQLGKKYVHFIPYLINLIILFPFFIKSAEEKIQILDYFTASIASGTDTYFYYSFILRLAISIISISYAFSSLKIVRAYSNKLKNEYSNTEALKLDWLRILLNSFMVLSVFFIITSIITFGDRYPQFDYDVFYFLFIFILIYILGYKALSQSKIKTFIDDENSSKDVLKSKVENKELTFQAEQLIAYVIQEKPYLNGELKASELAKDINLTRHRLSQILNKALGKNFYDFINEYRAEEFKNRLQSAENDHLTLLGIALDSGFNSKTTFNTIFKKITGLTPSAYKKSIK